MLFKDLFKETEEEVKRIKEVSFDQNSEFYLINRVVTDNYSDEKTTYDYLRVTVNEVSINIKTIAIKNNGVFQEFLTGVPILTKNIFEEMIKNNRYEEVRKILDTYLLISYLKPISNEEAAKILLDIEQNKSYSNSSKKEYCNEILRIIEDTKNKYLRSIEKSEEEYKKKVYAKEHADSIIKRFIKVKD